MNYNYWFSNLFTHCILFIFLIIIAVCLLWAIFQTYDCFSNIKRHDICSRPLNQKRVYTAIGSRGIVYAKNDIFDNLSKFNVSKYNTSLY